MEKFKGMFVFIGLRALRLRPLLSHHNILYSCVQNQTLTCVMLRESNDMVYYQCCCISVIPIYNSAVIKNKLSSLKL